MIKIRLVKIGPYTFSGGRTIFGGGAYSFGGSYSFEGLVYFLRESYTFGGAYTFGGSYTFGKAGLTPAEILQNQNRFPRSFQFDHVFASSREVWSGGQLFFVKNPSTNPHNFWKSVDS